MPNMKKILIIQTAFIGDVILATAMANSLKAYDENIITDFLVNQKNVHLLEGNTSIREVFGWDKSSKKYKNLFSLIRKLRKEKYDHIINLHRFGSSGFLTVRGGAKQTIGFSKNPFSFPSSKSAH